VIELLCGVIADMLGAVQIDCQLGEASKSYVHECDDGTATPHSTIAPLSLGSYIERWPHLEDECPMDEDDREECTLLDDLHDFQCMLESPLESAVEALEGSDPALFHETKRISQRLRDLITCAGFVVKEQGVVACGIMQVTATQGNLDACLISKFRSQLAKMKKDAIDVRGSYLELIGAVDYLITCLRLEVDFSESTEEQDGSGCCGLRASLSELQLLYKLLGNPSDFWLNLHATELEFARLEGMARSGCDGSLFHAALEALCLQLIPPAH
jgi:hypothetical protein